MTPIIPAQTIAQLPPATAITGAEFVPITQAGKTVRTPIGNITAGIIGIPISVFPYNIPAVTGITVSAIFAADAMVTVNLPLVPAVNQIAVIVDAGLTANVGLITINGNGNTIVAYGSSGTAIGIDSAGGSVWLLWAGNQWTQIA